MVLGDRGRRSNGDENGELELYQDNMGNCITELLVGSRIPERMKETDDL